MDYATLYEAKEYIGLSSTATSDDARLLKFLKWSTGLINGYKQRRYDVRYETIKHDAPLSIQNTFGQFGTGRHTATHQQSLILNDYLLQVKELKNGDGEIFPEGSFFLEPAFAPYVNVALANGYHWAADSDGNLKQAISVTGLWGFREAFSNAFDDSLDTVLDDPLAQNSSVIHVEDVNGITSSLLSPRFQSGQLIRIGDELIYIISATRITDGNDELRVVRHYNGSSATEHALGSKIEIFRPMDSINQVALRLVKWRYTQKDVDVFDKTYNVGTGTVTTPASLPADVRDILGTRGKVRL